MWAGDKIIINIEMCVVYIYNVNVKKRTVHVSLKETKNFLNKEMVVNIKILKIKEITRERNFGIWRKLKI